jgi:hypothetical protein
MENLMVSDVKVLNSGLEEVEGALLAHPMCNRKRDKMRNEFNFMLQI